MNLSDLIVAVGDVAENAGRLHETIHQGKRLDPEIVIEDLVRNQVQLARQLYILARVRTHIEH